MFRAKFSFKHSFYHLFITNKCKQNCPTTVSVNEIELDIPIGKKVKPGSIIYKSIHNCCGKNSCTLIVSKKKTLFFLFLTNKNFFK